MRFLHRCERPHYVIPRSGRVRAGLREACGATDKPTEVCDSPHSLASYRAEESCRRRLAGRVPVVAAMPRRRQILLDFQEVIGQHAGLLGRPPRPLTIISSPASRPRLVPDDSCLRGLGRRLLRARAGSSVMQYAFETQRARAVSEVRSWKCTGASRDAK